jgi:hypothetical protein
MITFIKLNALPQLGSINGVDPRISPQNARPRAKLPFSRAARARTTRMLVGGSARHTFEQ